VTDRAVPQFVAPPRRFAFRQPPDLVAAVRTAPGRIALLVLCAALLKPATEVWPAIVLAIAAISFTARRRAAMVTTLATLGAFAAAPDWSGVSAPALVAERAGLSHWLTPVLRWGAPCVVLGFGALFLAAARAGRPRFAARHPLLCLLAVFFVLLTAAIAGPGGAEIRVWLWALAAAFSGYMWFIALVAAEQRNNASRVPFWQQFGVLHPFWGSTGIPYAVAPHKLGKISACDDDALAISQIKGLKLLAWADVILMISAAYAAVVHKRLGVPPFHDALAAYMGQGLSWNLRWLSLFSEFFEAVARLAAMGHVIIACARLAGYNLPRNTYRPFASRNVAEFWGRYYYYFKELLLNLFYFPTYLSCFRAHPRLRAAFATFMAAGVGNFLFHFIRELDQVAALGFWRALAGLQTYAFYCVMLSAGIAVSQQRSRRRRPVESLLRKRILPFVSVMGFFCLLQVFDETGRSAPLADHVEFFFGLFLPFR
jgi:hypothetical protein